MPGPAEIAAWLDKRLDAERFRASEPENGLILDAGRDVQALASSVNTTFASIQAAADAGAELLLVHHPTWPYIDLDLHQQKLNALRKAGVSLYAAHASLDAAEDGTATELANMLGVVIEGRFATYHGGLAGVYGRFTGGWEVLLERTANVVGTALEAHRHRSECELVGIVTGAGGLTGWLQEARTIGCDTYLTGEGSMYTRIFALEAGLNLVLAGHDVTETPGIEALGRVTAHHFRLAHVPIREAHIG